MELILFFAGALLSWLIAHVYYRLSSKKPPEWAKPLIEKLPETPLSEDGLIDAVRSYVKERNLEEHGKNSNGEYIRYGNGEQVCKGTFTVKTTIDESRKIVVFPAQFQSAPSIELSGDVSRLKSKNASGSTMELVFDMRDTQEELNIGYQARGQWTKGSENQVLQSGI